MPHKKVAVVAAMRMELAPLLRDVVSKRVDGIEYFELDAGVVAVGGVGRAAATRTAEAVMVKYQPSKVLSAGLVGAITAKLKVGDVVHAREVIDADSGARFVSADGGNGTLVTASSVSGPEEKRKLALRWNADVLDMEGAAVAEQAQRSGIPFSAVKAVSDEVDFVMPPLGKFVNDEGKFETLRFLAYVAFRPKWWNDVRELSANSRKASKSLCAVLQHLIS
jgi:adenosylhomocysteine nucleosidase